MPSRPSKSYHRNGAYVHYLSLVATLLSGGSGVRAEFRVNSKLGRTPSARTPSGWRRSTQEFLEGARKIWRRWLCPAPP